MSNNLSNKISIVTLGSFPSKEIILTIQESLEFAETLSIEWIFILYKENEVQDFVKYFNKIKTIKITYKVNFCSLGIAKSMNKGIKMSSNPWILILHSGDYIIKNKNNYKQIKERLSLASNKSINIFGSIYKSESGLVSYSNHHRKKIRSLKSPWVPHQSTFVHRTIYEHYIYDCKIKSAMDYEFFLRCYFAGIKFITWPEYITIYQLGGESSDVFQSVCDVYTALEKNANDNSILLSIYHLLFVIILYLKKILFKIKNLNQII